MKSNWAVYSVGECLEKVIDNRGKTPPISDMTNGVPLVEINALVGSGKFPNLRIIKKFVNSETHNTWFRSGHPTAGDILFSTVGSIAEVAMANTQNICIAQNIIALRPNNRVITADYLYYFLKNPSTQKKLKSLDISSVQPSIKVPHLLAIEILVPSISEQKNIADTLSALDDRISLLRETNATLEAIAQALFKSWFVDFDPVRAKAEGREPEGMPAEVADLFPSEFEDTELGEIPKGWKLGTLTEELKVAYGKNLPTTKLLRAGFPVYGGNGKIGYFDKYTYDTRQVLISCRGAASGKINLSPPKSFITNNSLVIETSKKTHIPFGYIKGFMQKSDLTGYITGSAQPQITIENLKTFRVLVPPKLIMSAFEDISEGIENKIETNEQQLISLTDLRDTLLPRLMSGKLRIPDLEEQAA